MEPTSLTSIPASAAGRPAPKLEDEPPVPRDLQLGWALVGLGKLTLGELLPAFAETRFCKLTALVSGNPGKARQVATQQGLELDAIYDYSGFDRIALDQRVDVVYIVLPNALHADYTIRALRAGKHVLCEKPMATTVDQCEAMIGAAEEAKRKLMIAYRAQFEPHNLDAMRRVRSGELGRLRAVITDTGRPTDPKDPADQWRLLRDLAGGGSLIDIGIYGLNAARYLTGEEPVEVSARIHNPPDDARFHEVEDVVAWQLRFPSGLLANGTSSYSYVDTSRFEVIGTEGRITMDPATPYRGNHLRIATAGGEQAPRLRSVNQFAREMDHLSEAIMRGADVTTPGEEGLLDVRLMLAIYQSALTGRPVPTDWGYRRRIDPAAGQI